MFDTTLRLLKCPTRDGRCGGELKLSSTRSVPGPRKGVSDVLTGEIRCSKCQKRFPILAGVAVLVPEVRDYLVEHVKGVTQRVAEKDLPKEHRAALAEAREEIEEGHIDEDLEAERVNALYVMTHYLSAGGTAWWASENGEASPFIAETVKKYWDQGPFSVIRQELPAGKASLVELGCGPGLLAALAPKLGSYLGVDSSFASIALARHLAFGAPLEGRLLFPADLLAGPVSRELALPRPALEGIDADFVVCDATRPALREASWELCAALNMIDMLDSPEGIPKLQQELLKPGGTAIQTCPYIWHPGVATELRGRLPREIEDSAGAAEWLYEQAGFRVSKSHRHVPWLFFKHLRQLEIYSVHVFFASRS